MYAYVCAVYPPAADTTSFVPVRPLAGYGPKMPPTNLNKKAAPRNRNAACSGLAMTLLPGDTRNITIHIQTGFTVINDQLAILAMFVIIAIAFTFLGNTAAFIDHGRLAFSRFCTTYRLAVLVVLARIRLSGRITVFYILRLQCHALLRLGIANRLALRISRASIRC